MYKLCKSRLLEGKYVDKLANESFLFTRLISTNEDRRYLQSGLVQILYCPALLTP